jgi:hypothetical protein
MAAPSSAGDRDNRSALVISELRSCLANARQFVPEYDKELTAFQRSSAVFRVISKAFVDYLANETDLDPDRLDAAEQSFYSAWIRSPQHHRLEAQLDALLDRSAIALNKAFRRAPSLRDAHSAKKLPTKVSRLATTLALAIPRTEAWVASSKELPVRQVRKPGVRAHQPTKTKDLLPDTWWEWLAVVAAFFAIAGALPSLVGITGWVALGWAVLAVVILIGADVAVRSQRG